MKEIWEESLKKSKDDIENGRIVPIEPVLQRLQESIV